MRGAGRSVIFLGLVLLLSMEEIPLLSLYTLVVLAGMLSPLSSAGAQTLLPRLVPNKELLVNGRKPMLMLVVFTFLFNMGYGPVEVAMLAMGIAGLSFSPYNIIYRSYLQKEVPDELLERVMTSIRTITGTGMPAGAAVCGVLIPLMGVQGLLGAGAAACVVIGIFALFLLRGLDCASLAVDQRSSDALHPGGQQGIELGKKRKL